VGVYRAVFLTKFLSYCHRTDEAAKATVHLLDVATCQERGNRKTAANIAFGFDGSIFTWMASPGNEWRGKRTGNAMVQLHNMSNEGMGKGMLRISSCGDIYQKLQISLGRSMQPQS